MDTRHFSYGKANIVQMPYTRKPLLRKVDSICDGATRGMPLDRRLATSYQSAFQRGVALPGKVNSTARKRLALPSAKNR